MLRSLLSLGLLAVTLGLPVNASIVLQNGSFESTGAALGSGLLAVNNWTNNSGLAIQASSAPAGFEVTPAAGVTGSRFLRLASDNPNPANTGFIVQNMGTMVAGETYTITGDLLGGGSVNNPFSVFARLTSDGSNTPGTTYASQTTSPIGSLVFVSGGLLLSYTATGADNGNPLFISLRAVPSGAGQALRGGLDNLVLQTTAAPVPEPSTLALAGIAGLVLALRRRR